MEPISFTIGVAGISGLFSASLDALDRISAAKSYGTDYHLFTTKLSSERRRLIRWGHAVGLTPGSGVSHALLQDPEIREEVRELLTWVVYFFEDSEGIIKRHGAGVIGYPRERARMLQNSAGIMVKFRWAFSGKAKAKGILEELAWLVGRLHELVPVHRAEMSELDLTSAIRMAVLLSAPVVEGVVGPRLIEHTMAPPATLPNNGVEILPLATSTETALRLTNQSGATRLRVENRRLQSHVRRARLKHARCITAGAAAETEQKIRANER
jgi:predicted DNA-binding protein (UPF0251 family)